jgi:hypothetical protein
MGDRAQIPARVPILMARERRVEGIVWFTIERRDSG